MSSAIFRIEPQPALLLRAAAKAENRRFSGAPLSGFGEVALPRWRPEGVRLALAFALACWAALAGVLS